MQLQDKPQEISKISIQETLGRGGYGVVYRAIYYPMNCEAAVKVINKKKIIDSGMYDRIKNEISLHTSLEHPNIVKLLDNFEDDTNIYMVLEQCEQDLRQYVSCNGQLQIALARTLFCQLIDGVAYLHSNNVIHRDLKLSNLLLTSSMNLKISDFGLAVQLTDPIEPHYTLCGTPNFIAPEVLRPNVGHTFPVDIWSCGCILYAIIFGKPPFQGSRVSDTLQNIMNHKEICVKSSFPLPVKLLLERLLDPDPTERPSALELSTNSWIKSDCYQKGRPVVKSTRTEDTIECDDSLPVFMARPTNKLAPYTNRPRLRHPTRRRLFSKGRVEHHESLDSESRKDNISPTSRTYDHDSVSSTSESEKERCSNYAVEEKSETPKRLGRVVFREESKEKKSWLGNEFTCDIFQPNVKDNFTCPSSPMITCIMASVSPTEFEFQIVGINGTIINYDLSAGYIMVSKCPHMPAPLKIYLQKDKESKIIFSFTEATKALATPYTVSYKIAKLSQLIVSRSLKLFHEHLWLDYVNQSESCDNLKSKIIFAEMPKINYDICSSDNENSHLHKSNLTESSYWVNPVIDDTSSSTNQRTPMVNTFMESEMNLVDVSSDYLDWIGVGNASINQSDNSMLLSFTDGTSLLIDSKCQNFVFMIQSRETIEFSAGESCSYTQDQQDKLLIALRVVDHLLKYNEAKTEQMANI